MKILELTRSFYPSVGGMEKFVADRFKIYEELGIDYNLISTNYSTEKRDRNLSRDDVIFINQYTPYNITPNLKKYLDNDYDVLSINQFGRYFSDYAINYVSKNKKTKIILTPHFYFHTERFSFIKSLHKKLIAKKLLDKIDKIICFTEYEKKYLLKYFDVESNKIDIIPHYIVTDKEKYNLSGPTYKNYFLYLGRAEKNKRYDLLIEAFDQLKIKDLKLLLTIRNQDLKSKYKRIVERNGNIHLLGYITEREKFKYISNCKAVVFASDYEAFGTVVLEASKFKKPILCSDLSVFKEILSPQGTMFFKNEVHELKNTLNNFLAKSISDKEIMGDDNYKNLKNFTFEKCLKSYKELFFSL